MDYARRYKQWMDNGDEKTCRELEGLSQAEVEDRFYTELSFGTAGLRGLIGAGTNRMNTYVVRRATQGLCDYLHCLPDVDKRGVVIAYDSRHYSSDFAMEAALVLAQNGVEAYLFESLRAVPQLSFAVRHLHCIAGIVITASHNPAAYNGYKVYWEHGGQLGPDEAEAVYRAMQQIGYFDVEPMEREDALRAGLLKMIGSGVDEAYYAATQTLLLQRELLKEKGGALQLVYTPLHGAGNIPVRELLGRVGVTNVHVVKEQEKPNAAFPTVEAPNPEDPNAFTLAIALANEVGADTILATDPDSDRLGVAVREKDGTFCVLTGNQIGCLLLHYMLSTLHAQGRLPANAFAAKSIVSTRLFDVICARYGVELEAVLTGFRYISEKIDEAERSGKRKFLFGFEESYGFLAGGFSRDKDAVCAAMLVAEACVSYAQRGVSLCGALQEIYEEYGYYQERVKSYTLMGKAGMERIAGAMAALRARPVTALSGVRVAVQEDYQSGRAICLADEEERALMLPKTNMLRYLFENGAWMVARPSGTEPKLKLYIGANEKTEQGVAALLHGLMDEADRLVSGYLGLE